MRGEGVRFSKRSVLIVIILAFVSTYLTVYTLEAHTVAARHIYEDPEGEAISWRTGPSGSLFPWPTEPGMLEVLSEIDGVDLFIYRYLIRNWVLIGLSILMCVATGLSIFKVVKAQRALLR